MALKFSAPLCVPCQYDQNLRVDVCLNEPLRDQIVLSEFFLADFFTRLSYLDVVLRKHLLLSKAQESVKRKRRVSVGSHLSQAEELAMQLSEMVEDLGLPSRDPLKHFISELEMTNMMPNAAEYINSSCAMPDRLHTSGIDYYLTEVNNLHQLHAMSATIHQDVALGTNHKYVAHQVVILYQLLKQFGEEFAKCRSSVEANFDPLKAACAVASEKNSRIPEKLATWLAKLTSLLSSASLSIPEQCERYPHMQLMYQIFESQ